MHDWGLSVTQQYSTISEEEIDAFVTPLLNANPLLGISVYNSK